MKEVTHRALCFNGPHEGSSGFPNGFKHELVG